MEKPYQFFIFLILTLAVDINTVNAQNPIIRNQFTADPSARVFNGKVYLFPSHDILCEEGQGRPDWFCMEDYHVFSSNNLTEWIDHGIIVTQNKVKWADSNSYSMWAPDCIERNGKYYFYFPARTKHSDSLGRKMFSIGVAIADNPEGPYITQPEPIKNVRGIDPNVFIDKDGQAYLYWSAREIFVARLNNNMLELDSEPLIIPNLPKKGLKEGPWIFERNGIYYLTFPHVENETERLEYAMGSHPFGPFKMAGVIMDEFPSKCWTNHHSIIEFNGQWYLFYHHNDYSPHFDKNRSARIDSLFFNSDGTIQKVNPTLRGAGITNASQKIEIDRYSHINETGVKIAFLDSSDAFKGWKTVFKSPGSWIQYNSVKFDKNICNAIHIKALAQTGGIIEIQIINANFLKTVRIEIPASDNWEIIKSPVTGLSPGTYNLKVLLINSNQVEVDWISFISDK